MKWVGGGPPRLPAGEWSLLFFFTVHLLTICRSTLSSGFWSMRLLLLVPIEAREIPNNNLRAMRGIGDNPMSGAGRSFRKQPRGVTLRYRS